MLFEFLNQITLTKKPDFIAKMDEAEIKKLNPFICNLWLSMNDNFLPLAAYLNKYTFSLSLEHYYQLCRYVLPVRKSHFPWIKTNKEKREKIPDWIIDIFKKEFEFISKKEINEYIEMLLLGKGNFDKLDLKLILMKYPLDVKQWKWIDSHFKVNREVEEIKVGKIKKPSENNLEDMFE